MTDFQNTFVGKNLVALGHVLSHLWIAARPTVQAAAMAAGKDAAEIAAGAAVASLKAAADAHNNGGGKDAVLDAAKSAAENHVKTVGVTIALDDIGHLAGNAVTLATAPPPVL